MADKTFRDLGPVTAYAAAVEKGYFSGTEAEWLTMLSNVSEYASQAQESAGEAADSAAAAQESAATFTTDPTLTISGKAADAKAAGDAINAKSGLSNEAKQALLACFENVAWINDQGQSYVDALEAALYPPANLVSISAVYTQSGTVYDTDTLDSLKADLVVTATYDNGTTATVTAYTLSGTLTEGTSTITVSYGGKTTTFTVAVTRLEIRVFRGKGVSGTSIVDNAKRALSEPVAFTNVAPITMEWPSLSAFRVSFKNTTTDINTIDTSAGSFVPIEYLNEPRPSSVSLEAWVTEGGEMFLTGSYAVGDILTPMTFSQSSGYVRLLFADISDISNPLPSESINSVFYINGIPYHLVEASVSEFE